MGRGMITVLGPTASGKTKLAAKLAVLLHGEVISADSRQVFRGMTIGTGKDYDDFVVEGHLVPYHLIDIEDSGAEYNIFRYQQDFLAAYNDIKLRGKVPILCGGSGMYLEAVLRGYKLTRAIPDNEFLKMLEGKTDGELEVMLREQKRLHNKTDLEDRNRMVMALLIEHQVNQNARGPAEESFPAIDSLVVGINHPRGLLKKRITERLTARLDAGMMAEIEQLIMQGVNPERLMRYGLEYRYGTMFVTGKISHDEMFHQLNQAIHQFAKRQMTWYRRMERNGVKIHWIDGRLPIAEMVLRTMSLYNTYLQGV